MTQKPNDAILAVLSHDFIEAVRSIVRQEIAQQNAEKATNTTNLIYSAQMAADFLNQLGTHKPVTSRTVTNWATAGKIPARQTNTGRYVFDRDELARWDQDGRPEVKEWISDFDCCPHCGSDRGFYQPRRAVAEWFDIRPFQGNANGSADWRFSSDMIDNLKDVWRSKFYYCTDCEKKICRAHDDDEQ